MVFGPAEALPERLAQLYDVNVVSTQRVNRAALPHLHAASAWPARVVSSSSARGGTPPFLAPYFAAKAAMDSLAVSYAAGSPLGHRNVDRRAGRVHPGHESLLHAGKPADTAVQAAYDGGPYAGVADRALKGLAALEPADADAAGAVATAIAELVAAPAGKRPTACSSTRRRTAPRKCSASAIASAARCPGTSGSPICSRRASAADPSRAGPAGTVLLARDDAVRVRAQHGRHGARSARAAARRVDLAEQPLHAGQMPPVVAAQVVDEPAHGQRTAAVELAVRSN
jgi:hypothetical protein